MSPRPKRPLSKQDRQDLALGAVFVLGLVSAVLVYVPGAFLPMSGLAGIGVVALVFWLFLRA